MAAKRPAKKSPAKTWMVNSNGQEMPVTADTIGLDDGSLVFTSDNELARAFAHGSWSSVALKEGEP